MATTKDALAFLLWEYPYASDLSNARVTKMVYLADWHHAVTYGSQITDIQWVFDNHGPFVWTVKDVASQNPQLFRVAESINYFGARKCEITLLNLDENPVIKESEAASIRHIVQATKEFDWDTFIRLVYSTYPIVNSARYSHLNLVARAAEYRSLTGKQEK
jgi:hypothetical protein